MKIISAVLGLFFSTVVWSTPLNHIVVFGDSLSDNGNLYEYMEHQFPLSPPYYEGRFTNGPVWVEHLAAAYYRENASAHLLDYAFGGAGIIPENEEDPEDTFFTLRREIDSYFLSHSNKADPNSLYVVWIGSNNYIALPENTEKSLHDVSAGIMNGLQRLINKGAKNFLIVNLPNLGKTPVARDLNEVDLLTHLTTRHNEILRDNITALQNQHTDVRWVYLDVDNIFVDLLNHPENYGFSNTTDTCYEAMIEKPSSNAILKMVATVKPHKKKDACEGYLFFDPVHPSGLAHAIMANNAKRLLDEAGIEFLNSYH